MAKEYSVEVSNKVFNILSLLKKNKLNNRLKNKLTDCIYLKLIVEISNIEFDINNSNPPLLDSFYNLRSLKKNNNYFSKSKFNIFDSDFVKKKHNLKKCNNLRLYYGCSSLEYKEENKVLIEDIIFTLDNVKSDLIKSSILKKYIDDLLLDIVSCYPQSNIKVLECKLVSDDEI